ncbi:hypothetical protein BDB01DRAFT_799769 [Pilobolus umbonatus]|nr:hypothetical protein BDB01DRAFT_799769 [Pilobolus umbonatus]
MADIRNYIFAERKRVIDIALQCDLTVICEKKELRGYQIYIVEQWVCDRNEPSNIVKVFTGDDSHVIQVAIIGIPVSLLRNPTLEIKRLLNDSSHLKLKPTPDGEIMLVDLTELRFDRDPILVPNGDYDACITQAYVNINLRRTNCTGRISLTLLSPNPTSEEKFRSSYKIADAAEFNDAVINLVKLVQKSLFLFGLLKEDYIDGLICNETKVALWIFHSQYGPVKSIDFSGKEPWLEPHLMASIVSKLLVCRNKLQDLNFTNVKDPFTDYNAFREDIGNYQVTNPSSILTPI